jgi:hypothetical protein
MAVSETSHAAHRSAADAQPSSAPFEQLLADNFRWAMSEGSQFFEGAGRVQQSLQRIARRLEELGLPYAVAGGMALFAHGHRRFTEDIDILVTRDDLERIHEALDGRGWVRPFEKSKNLRDAQTGVRIEFLIAGDYPGDGKPKAVSFPNPKDVAEIHDGIRVLQLPKLIELKLASYMTGKARSKDLGDVEELIRARNLPRDLADQLNPYVAPLFGKTWDEVRS